MIEMQKVYELSERIVQHFHPQKVILFGSYAYGAPTEDSDVDMLVIMPFEGRAAQKAVEILIATDPRFPIDLLVRTPEQIKTRIEMGDFFLREITKKGRVLYDSVRYNSRRVSQ
ncbi:MAG: nucleotidyltransferase domain-containing protein [Anaerolineales bacterium]